MIGLCCSGCSALVREKCEKAFNKTKESENFIYCNTQNIRLLIEVTKNE